MSGGVAGRSGPPGNRNAVGNPGGGAPIGSANARTHGVYSFLATGRLPANATDIEADLTQLREQLEAAVHEAHKGVDLQRAALIESAVRHEARARLLMRWLADNDLTNDQKLNALQQVSSATDRRDAVIAKLELNAKQESGQWNFLQIPKPNEEIGDRQAQPCE